MNERTKIISEILGRWLEMFTPPASIKGNHRASQDAADSLLRVILKFAPQADYATWVRRILDEAEYQMKTRAWPTVHELAAVCSNRRKSDASSPGKDDVQDRFERAAIRINNGDPVGDLWIYGNHAHELVQRGLVRESQLVEYRSGLFFAMKDAWGEDHARAVEAEFRRRHDACAPSMRKVGAA